MSKKRTSADSGTDEQSTEDSESLLQTEENAKRAKFDPESYTTLLDLPHELLECILVKAVVMEVKGLKLAKSVWKAKADLVISRLRPVCSLWSNVLTTKSFRTKLHRTLDGTAQTIRLEILHESSIRVGNHEVTTLKEEVFLLCKQLDGYYVINVYDRDNVDEVKDVIPLSVSIAQNMTGCNVSNCVYICIQHGYYHPRSVLRISREGKHTFNICPWMDDHGRSIYMMTVSPNGSLIILSLYRSSRSDVVSLYNADGTLQSEIMLSLDVVPGYGYKNVTQKSNGNVLLTYLNNDCLQTLAELDTSGSVVRQLDSSDQCLEDIIANLAGDNDTCRIMRTKDCKRIELLDSEFNLVGVYSLHKDQDKRHDLIDLHYDWTRDEIWGIYFDYSTYNTVLTVFRIME